MKLRKKTMGAKSASDVDIHIAQGLRLARMEVGLSQKELADRLGVTFQQVQKYENATNRISAGRLYRIADILGVDVLAFFAGAPTAPDEHRIRLSKQDREILAAVNKLDPAARKKLTEFLEVIVPADA